MVYKPTNWRGTTLYPILVFKKKTQGFSQHPRHKGKQFGKQRRKMTNFPTMYLYVYTIVVCSNYEKQNGLLMGIIHFWKTNNTDQQAIPGGETIHFGTNGKQIIEQIAVMHRARW